MATNKMLECSLCRKRFTTEKGGVAHLRDFHSKRIDGKILKVRQKPVDDEMSEADYLIEQQWNF